LLELIGERLEGVGGEQIAFVKKLCHLVSDPPIDLVAVGSPILLIEVKTTAREAKK
jgi:hypothetical protein